jgi:hypothetical protein
MRAKVMSVPYQPNVMPVPYQTRFFKRQHYEAATSPSVQPDGFSSPRTLGDDGGVRLRDSGDEEEEEEEDAEEEGQGMERAQARKKRKISCEEALRALRTIEIYFAQEGLDPQEEFFPDFLQMRGGIVRAGEEQAGGEGEEEEGEGEEEEEEESDVPSEISSSSSLGSAYSGGDEGEGED